VKRCLEFLLLVILVSLSFWSVAWGSASPEPSNKTIPKEIKIGKKTAEQVEKEIPRAHDPSREAKLAMITNRLTCRWQLRAG